MGGKRYAENVCMYVALFGLYSWDNYPNCVPQGAPQGKRSQGCMQRPLNV